MLTSIVENSKINIKPIISTTTRLKEQLTENKNNLEIFKNLKENEKLGKQLENGKSVYYKVTNNTTLWVSRWWYGEGRMKTIQYLDNDFSEFMRFLDNLLKNLEIDPFCRYAKMAQDVRLFIDDILPGLYSLKKTYPDTKEMIAKVDSIILTLIDFKDKTDDYINQKNKGIRLLIGATTTL